MDVQRRFTYIKADFPEDETRFFGSRNEFSAPKSLYEVHTIATITEEKNDENDENEALNTNGSISAKNVEIPLITCAYAEEVIAVAVGTYINVVKENKMDANVTIHVRGIEKIIALCFLPDTDIIAAVSKDAKLVFISVLYEVVICKLDLEKCILDEAASIKAVSESGDYYISVVSGNKCYSVPLYNFHKALSVYNQPENSHNLIKQLRETPVTCIKHDSSASDVAVLPSVLSNLLVPSDEGGFLTLVSFGCGRETFSHLLCEHICGFVKARFCCDKHILLLLSKSGRVIAVDTFTFCVLFEKLVLPEGECPLDFLILDCDSSALTLSTRIALLVEHKSTLQFQIRSFSGEVFYSIVVTQNSFLLDSMSKENGTVYFLEFVDSTKGSDDFIRLRSVYECDPESRLRRLLNRGQYDEAEQHARIFRLDLQIVHKARADRLLTSLDSEENEREIFDGFINCLNKIQDDNWVGETCSSAATLFKYFDSIAYILDYAKKRKITDVETSESLSRLRYNFATYRMLFGPAKTSFEHDSVWDRLLCDDLRKDVFLDFCERGCATEARLMWNRYSSDLKFWMQSKFEAFASFFGILCSYVDNEWPLEEIFELTERELLPLVMYFHPHDLLENFFDKVLSLGNKLESLHFSSFPENALYVCSVVERTTKSMVANAVTPLQQAQLARTLAIIRVDSEDEVYPMGRLNVYVKNLKELDKLKSKFDCQLKYDEYKKQTDEGICYLILGRAKNVGLVKSNIEQFAIPFMEEYKLDIDQTLFNYILKIPQKAADGDREVISWDERCLAIAETIKSFGLRCKAVINIAKRAFPPWTENLRRTVEAMLRDSTVDAALKTELQKQCEMEQLGQLLMKYAVPFPKLRDIIKNSRYVSSLVSFILRQEHVFDDLEKRISDACLVIVVLEKLRPEMSTRVTCYLQCCFFIVSSLKANDEFRTLKGFLSRIEKNDLMNVVKRIVASAVSEVDCEVPVLTEGGKSLRLAKIDAALCVLENYSTEKALDSLLSEKLRTVKKLQERFNVFVGLTVLECEAKKQALFRNFIRAENNIKDIPKFADALTIDYETTCVIAADCAIGSNNPLLATRFAMFGLRSVDTVSRSLLDVSMRSSILLLKALPELAVDEYLEQLFDVMEALAKTVPLLVEAAVSSAYIRHSAFALSGYIRLFFWIKNLCMLDINGKKTHVDVPDNNKVFQAKTEKSEIYGMNRRLGVYLPYSDGHIFDKIETLSAIANVASSVIERNDEEGDNFVQSYEEMRNNWMNVFCCLVPQPYLQLCCRSFSAYLPCFREEMFMQFKLMENSLHDLVKRVLLLNPTDLSLISSALFAVPADLAKKILKQLRNCVKTPKAPQRTLNLIRVSRFVSICHGDCTALEQITQDYARCAWIRRMQNLGGTMPSDNSTKSVVQSFVEARISVDHLLDFCGDFNLDKCEAVLQYALKMGELCSVTQDSVVFDEMFGFASKAFRLLTVTEDIFLRIYDALMVSCPYNYAVIDLFITEMKKRARKEDEYQILLVKRLITIFQLLIATERVNAPTEWELRWYQERQKFIENKEGRTFSTSVNSESTLLNSSAAGQNAYAEQYTKTMHGRLYITSSKLPTNARHRFPFHVFLFDDKRDIRNILLPIINAELTIHNVNFWQELARSLPDLSISKSNLLSSAIVVFINLHIQNGTCMDTYDVERIESLLFNASNQRRIVDTLRNNIMGKSLLCDTKLRLLEIGVNVSKKWLDAVDLQHPLTDETRVYVQEQLRMLIPELKLVKTECLLRKAGLYKDGIDHLVTSAEHLIIHIYSEEIVWDDSRDKEKKLQLIKDIAEIYKLDLVAIQEKLLEDWMPASASRAATFDLNETDGDAVMSDHLDVDAASELPFLDESLTRILHLLTLRDLSQAARRLKFESAKDSSSFNTKVRSICCLLRLCSSAELEKFVREDVRSLCETLRDLLYKRLLESCGMEIPLQDFYKSLDDREKKYALARSLMSTKCRPTNQSSLTYLLTCMAIDFELVDCSLTGRLIKHLCANNDKKILIELLRFCSGFPEMARFSGLAQLWAWTADWMASQIDMNSLMVKQLIHTFIYFCLSCPAEGGTSFGSLCTTVDSFQLPVASQLIRVAESATVTLPLSLLKDQRPCKANGLDLPLRWRKEDTRTN